jgi:blocked early in transport 1
MVEKLFGKVRILKDVTVKIGEKVRDSSNFMDTMNENFENTRVYLSGTGRRMQRIAKRQGVGWFAVMMFLCLVFLIFL